MNFKHNLTDPQESPSKRIKKECSYGESCYRKNPAHFREFSHPHLESIIDNTSDDGDYIIPPHLQMQRIMLKEQIDIIIEKNIYMPKSSILQEEKDDNITISSTEGIPKNRVDLNMEKKLELVNKISNNKEESDKRIIEQKKREDLMPSSSQKVKDGDYRPMVQPMKKAEDYLKVVLPKGKMAEKHKNSAPYYIFYTTITDSRDTHNHPLSITFQEILDVSLGELKSSLQINFMVEPGWLLAQYYFAGYSNKKLTILYGEDCSELRNITMKKPHVEAHQVNMGNPFGKHHTKMMILCYEDGSLRVVISTANLYFDDWENRTQGLWFSPKCPELSESAMPFEGESPTEFKKCLLRYLNHYHLPQLSYYVERVKRCDFSHIKVAVIYYDKEKERNAKKRVKYGLEYNVVKSVFLKFANVLQHGKIHSSHPILSVMGKELNISPQSMYRLVNRFKVINNNIVEVREKSRSVIRYPKPKYRGRLPKVDMNIQKQIFLKYQSVLKDENIRCSNPIYKVMAEELDMTPKAIHLAAKRFMARNKMTLIREVEGNRGYCMLQNNTTAVTIEQPHQVYVKGEILPSVKK